MPTPGKHHSGNDSNDTKSRIKHATNSSFVAHLPEKHHFGNENEIAHRVGGTFPSLPYNHPTNFRQLGPNSTRANVNDAKPATKRGDQKFGNPRKYA